MALDTYEGLKAAIEGHVDRDLTDYIDDFIDLAEARHKSEVRIREMLERRAVNVTARYMSLPSRWCGGKSLRLLTTPITALSNVEVARMDRIRLEGQGRPRAYTIHDQIEFDCDPDKSYPGELLFYQCVEPLDDSNACNEILLRDPALYLYGALAATAPWQMHDERLPLWEDLYTKALGRINSSSTETIGTPIARVSGKLP